MQEREPIADTRLELLDALAAMHARTTQIGRPRIERDPVDRIPALALPIAEVDFLQTRIDPTRATEVSRERFGQTRASLQRAREELQRRGRAKLGKPPEHGLRGSRRIAGQRHVRAAVADAEIDRRLGVPD